VKPVKNWSHRHKRIGGTGKGHPGLLRRELSGLFHTKWLSDPMRNQRTVAVQACLTAPTR